MMFEQILDMIDGRRVRQVLLAVAIGVFFVCTDAICAETSYEVSEVLKVSSLSQFECRLKNYPYSKHARFKVQIRNVILNPEIPEGDAMEYLYERLKNAGHLALENVQFRNYFRLIADVKVDTRDLSSELIRQNLALPIKKTREKALSPEVPERSARAPVSRYKKTTSGQLPPPPRRRVVTLQGLLETIVDVSAINEETTIEESLDILADSVRPRLPFVILWNDLKANAMLEKDMPLGVGGFGRMKLRKVLEIILHSLSSRAKTKLILAVEGQVITVGTRNGLLQKSRSRAYSVEDLMSIPSDADEDSLLDATDGYSRGKRR
ncbi:MAG: hypothetical protein H8E62_10280 [Planctomycetes bacterium]|nr:hypothetical protein [Planctomycetota bacterium]